MSIRPQFFSAKNASTKGKVSILVSFVGTILFIIFFVLTLSSRYSLISPLATEKSKLESLHDVRMSDQEVFGFAPYWTLSKLENVDFTVLTTLAYFGLPIRTDGSIDKENIGYKKFISTEATELFKKAHTYGTRVVATITQMDNDTILSFLDNNEGQENAIEEIVNTVASRGIDGVNVDFEYVGNPGSEYKNKFSRFVARLSEKVHESNPNAQVTVSVYASSAKNEKMYDISSISESTDGIFMMAYDFATPGSSNVIPTAPLYGHKEGKYWYDISTAVDDFLKVMPKEKLILGLPWYGYDYPVSEPAIKASKHTGYYTYYWYRGRKYKRFVARPKAHASTYANAQSSTTDMQGWDEAGQVGWRAYQDYDGWRMLFLDDVRSLGIKYDFAKNKGLGGVGMWALGFDHGNSDMWTLLSQKFGKKLVDSRIANKMIYGE